MGLKRQVTVVALGASLILTGCQPKNSGGDPAGNPTGSPLSAPTASASVDASPLATGSPVASLSPGMTASPGASASPAAAAGNAQEISHSLVPLPGKEGTVPKITKKQTVKFRTTAGEVVIEVYPEAAPNAAARFVELVKAGFYDETPIGRVVPNFVAQFGVNWRAPHKAYKDKNFNDDPSLYALERGTLAFAKSGANSNSTQVFINFKENNNLADPSMNFTTFGKVVTGMEIVDKFAVVGDPTMGLDQQRLWEDGGAYLESLDLKPTMIEKASVVE